MIKPNDAKREDNKHILIEEIHGGILSIVINSPSTLNALSRIIIGELQEAFKNAAKNPEVMVILLTGTGKAFVAGADISSLADFSPKQASEFSTFGNQLLNLIEEIQKPIIAVINGFALGGGLELALACDLRFAAENAKLGLPETLLGIIPGFGGTQRLVSIVGFPKAKELILTGKKLNAEEAFQCGLVNKVFSKETLWDESVYFAKDLANRSIYALGQAKKVLNSTRGLPLTMGLKCENKAFSECFEHPDGREGIKAFLEKRNPEYGKN